MYCKWFVVVCCQNHHFLYRQTKLENECLCQSGMNFPIMSCQFRPSDHVLFASTEPLSIQYWFFLAIRMSSQN